MSGTRASSGAAAVYPAVARTAQHVEQDIDRTRRSGPVGAARAAAAASGTAPSTRSKPVAQMAAPSASTCV